MKLRSRLRRKRVNLTKRVIGVPGDTVVGRNGRVFVNGRKADDFPTAPFPAIHLGPKRYYVLGDNRSVAQDSRAFGQYHGVRSSPASSSFTGRWDGSGRRATTSEPSRRDT